MALTIYGSPRSRTLRTLWIAAELRLDYEHVPYAWDSPALKSPEFLALNPAGTIPMIVDDGVVVAESMAIAIHLARTHGDAGPEPLYPHGRQAEADVLRWSLWAQGHLEPWVQQDTRLGGLRAAIDAAAVEETARSLSALERALAIQPWLAAGYFTVADLNVAGVLSPSRAQHLQLHAYPAVEAWLARCYARPAARAVRERYA
jgi:glutathione S-transferase